MAMTSLHVPRLATINSLVAISRVKIALAFTHHSNNFLPRINYDSQQKYFDMIASRQSAVSAASEAGKSTFLPKSTSQILTTPDNGATYNGGANIHSLPNEMIDRVCAYLTFESLKNFRRVSQKYEPATKKYLYQTFVLWRTSHSWQKLGFIARTPELAMLVKCIKVARVSPLIHLSRMRWWDFSIGRRDSIYRKTLQNRD